MSRLLSDADKDCILGKEVEIIREKTSPLAISNLSGKFISALKFAFYKITLSSQNPIFVFNIRFLFLTADFSCAISFSRRWLNAPVCLIQARSEDDWGVS
jgi:hypothetical protein